MGVKSTVHLSREEAEQKYVELKQKHEARRFKAQAAFMDNRELESELESLSDKLAYETYGGEGFDNFLIVS